MTDEELFSHAANQLPPFVKRKARTDELCVMQQALTRDGRRHGNGVIVVIKYHFIHGPMISIITESGNWINNMSYSEFDAGFHAGEYILNSFPTFEARKAWEDRKYDRA